MPAKIANTLVMDHIRRRELTPAMMTAARLRSGANSARSRSITTRFNPASLALSQTSHGRDTRAAAALATRSNPKIVGSTPHQPRSMFQSFELHPAAARIASSSGPFAPPSHSASVTILQ